MKKLIAALCLLLVMLCCTALAEEPAVPELSEEEIHARLSALFEAEKAKALANAASNVIGDPMMIDRGDLTAYVGGKENDYFTVKYSIDDSMITVGEKAIFDVEVSSRYTPVYYMASIMVLDTDFEQISEGESSMKTSNSRYFENGYSYTSKRPGYVMFVFAAMDKYEYSITMSSATVQISYSWEDPVFDNMAMDNALGVWMSLDKNEISVGETVTATLVVTRDVGPVTYAGGWTLYDKSLNHLDETTVFDSYYGAQTSTLTFPYTPTQEGEAVFLIVIGDGEDNKLTFNTAGVVVKDSGYRVSVIPARTSINAGESVTVNYSITGGHTCDSQAFYYGEVYYVDGEYYGGDFWDLDSRSGSFTLSPRVGEEFGCYVEASCDHFPYATDEKIVTLKGGIFGNVYANSSSAVSGKPISVTYSISGGKKPYQDVIVRGYTVDEDTENYVCIMQRPNSSARGTMTATPYLGDHVYFEVEVVEADGYTSYHWSGDIPLTGAPEVLAPELTVSLDKQSLIAGETLTVTYDMSGGSGTIFSGDGGATGSFAIMYNEDASYAFEADITAVSGKVYLTPTVPGTYWVYVIVKDGYGQEVNWESTAVFVDAAPVVKRIPGDANEDGYADLFDALLVLQYDAGWDVSLNTSNADVNADGYADLFDALIILQYDAGWDVTLQ